MMEWFKARNIWGAALLSMTDEEAGRFAKALWRYTMNGETTDVSGTEKGLLAMALLTLAGDDEKTAEISQKRAAAGSKGGSQRVANQANACFASNDQANEANACFASDGVANQANALNKNKIKNKKENKRDLDEDDDDDDDKGGWGTDEDIPPEELEAEAARRKAISITIEEQLGRRATPAEVTQIALRTRLAGQSPEMASLAIKMAAENGARNLIKYVAQIYNDWAGEYVKTPEEAEEYKIMYYRDKGSSWYTMDTFDNLREMHEARERRKAEHEAEGLE